MELNTSTICDRKIVPVTESGHALEAKWVATDLAESLGFDTVTREHAALVATELATNLVKHDAASGAVLIQSFRNQGIQCLELLSIDRGPGIESVERAMRDGYSTSGTLGNGLGAVQRLSSDFGIYSNLSSGTVIWSRIFAKPFTGKHAGVGGISFPKTGETACGDNWGYIESNNAIMLMVADGLGHGLEAGVASVAALEQLIKYGFVEPQVLLDHVHHALKSTRGAAVSVALIDKVERKIHYSALGNVAATMVHPQGRQGLVNQDGTAGFQASRIRQNSYTFPYGSYLIMHSDGLGSRWDLSDYPGLFGASPALICGMLFRDFTKGHDDATVVALRLSAQ